MSKTAQRKASAYRNGYQVGRHGWPAGVKGYRINSGDDAYWHRGLRDGRRDRLAAERLSRSWRYRLVAWLRRVLGPP